MSDTNESAYSECIINTPARDYNQKKYSLVPDLLTGWKPKNLKVSAPILIVYRSQLINQMLQYYFTQQDRIVYIGSRYTDSYSFHEKSQHLYTVKCSIPSQQVEIIFNNEINSETKPETYLRRFTGMNPSLKNEYIFNGNFQSGNLDAVFKGVTNNQYNVFLRPDTNTCGHTQWFYFKINNHYKQDRRIKINICNNKKEKTLYERGMRPYIRSKYLRQRKGMEWQQGGEKVSYTRLALRQQTEDNLTDGSFRKVNMFQNYYCLSFEYTFENSNDEVQFAYCPPYSYSDLNCYIQRLKTSIENRTPKGQDPFLTDTKLCKSLSGLDIPLLTVTNTTTSTTTHMDEEKKICVIVTGRIHPGESNSSYAVEGFLDYITSSQASFLRDRVIFKIIPMVNPDGVVFGNYRTGLSGKDLNRQFKTKNSQLYPQVCQLKQLVRKIRAEEQFKLSYYLDFHGHSLKKNVFVYGPEYQIWTAKYEKAKQLPRIVAQKCEAFRYKSCLFKVAPFKRTTGRAFMLSFIPYCYTIESSVGMYSQKKGHDIPFSVEKWREVGQAFAKTIQSILNKNAEESKIKHDRKMSKKKPETNILDHSLEESSESVSIEKISSHCSKKHLEPIKNFKKTMIEMPLKYPIINEEECESDHFSQGNSDMESESNDFTKEEYAQLKEKIMKLVHNFQLFFNGRKSKFVISEKQKWKGKSKNKAKEKKRWQGQEMRLVPSLKHKMKTLNSLQKGMILGLDYPLKNTQ